MARIDLRDCTIYLKDGLSGTSVVNQGAPAANDTTVNISTVNLNTVDTDLVPVGARFTQPNGSTVYTVTARVPASNSPTTQVTFTPAWGTPPANGNTMTFQSQQLEVKIGEGNLTYTEAREFEYMLDRGSLDTVREGDDQPMEVSLEFVYEFVTTGTSEDITPVDALKRQNDASEWVSSSTDACEPYAVDMVIEHNVTCGATQDEITTLPDFRYESLEFNLNDATISVSGRCNVTGASIVRQ